MEQQLRHNMGEKAAERAALFSATAKGVAEMPQGTVIPSVALGSKLNCLSIPSILLMSELHWGS
jgi:hypothetical protein